MAEAQYGSNARGKTIGLSGSVKVRKYDSPNRNQSAAQTPNADLINADEEQVDLTQLFAQYQGIKDFWQKKILLLNIQGAASMQEFYT